MMKTGDDKKGEEDEYNSIYHGTGAQMKEFYYF